MNVVFAVVLSTATLFGQQPTTAPAFEAASIKRNLSADDFAEGGFMPGGRITAINVTLVNLMVAAYNVAPDRDGGGNQADAPESSDRAIRAEQSNGCA